MHLELARFTVNPEAVSDLLAGRPAMLDAMRRHVSGFRDAHLARLDGGAWLDIGFWDSREQFAAAMAQAPTIPAVGSWLALIAEVVSMEQAEIVAPVEAPEGAPR